MFLPMGVFGKKKAVPHTLTMPKKYCGMNSDDMNYGGFNVLCIPCFLSALTLVGLGALTWTYKVDLRAKIIISVVLGVPAIIMIATGIKIGWFEPAGSEMPNVIPDGQPVYSAGSTRTNTRNTSLIDVTGE